MVDSTFSLIHICLQILQRGMNKLKLMQYELETIKMESILQTAGNLPNEYFILCLWDLKTGKL